MVNNINWDDYWIVLSVLAFIYYAYIILAYYRRDIIKRFSSKNYSLGKSFETVSHPTKQSFQDQKIDTEKELFPQVQLLADEINAYLNEAANTGAVKGEILFAIQKITGKFPNLINSPYQNAIGQLIQFECGNKCAIPLSEDELKQVWLVR